MGLLAQLDGLSVKDVAYVKNKMIMKAQEPAYTAAGFSKTSWYRIDEEHRQKLNDLADQLLLDALAQGILMIQDQVSTSVKGLIILSESAKNEGVMLKAILEVLDRGGMPKTSHVDITSEGKPVLKIDM